MSSPRIFLVAGEPSGDLLGARLMTAIRRLTADQVSFAGVGGDQMRAAGLDSLVPIEELAVMGLVEVLPRLPNLVRRLGEVAAAARAFQPDVMVTIDSPGFTFRLARRLRGAGFPIVHYVAPQTWAWRPKRAEKLIKLFDHMLALLPFEPAWFAPYGIPTSFVGHSVIESGAARGDAARFRARHGLNGEAPILVLLPGSRRSEVSRLLGVFGETARRLTARHPGLVTVVPTLPWLVDDIAAGLAELRPIVVTDSNDKFDAFAAGTVACAASGTVALELALAHTPHLVAYRVNPATAWLVRRLITVKYVNLMNLVLDRPVVPELLQDDCTADKLTATLERLMIDGPERQAQVAAIAEVTLVLGGEGPPPSERAAKVVLQLAARRP